MQQLKSHNNGFRYLLNVIDVFSKFVWSIPIKDKTGKTITESFDYIVKTSKRRPEKLWVDNGTEFYNKVFQKWLDDNDIKIYSTYNEGKAVVIERFNRTLKNKMYKYFTAKNTYKYVDVLPVLINEYNNHKHSTIKMTPKAASMKRNEKIVLNNIYPDDDKNEMFNNKFMVGDRVRISKYKRKVFDKGYTPNWSEEVFVIDGIQLTNPTTYIIKDYNNEIIEGSFYEQELQKTDQEIYRIHKVIRKDYKKKLALVSWKGYPKQFNSWIPIEDVKSIR